MKSINLKDCANLLIEELKKRSNLFEKFNILVPSKALEDWFKNYWLKQGNDVLMNVNFYTFDSLVNTLYNKKYLLSELDYKILLVSLLDKNYDKFDLTKEYLDKSSNDYQNKLYDISDSLVTLFNNYDDDLVDLTSDTLEIKNLVISIAHEFNLYTLREIIETFNFKDIGKIFTFGFVNNTNLENYLLDKYKNVMHFDIDKDFNYEKSNITLYKCPSKKKEIELVHSKICNLLLNEDNKYSDFLVLSSDILEYQIAIKEVFEQDNVHFLSIPYNIKQNSNNLSDTYLLFEILFNSISNNTFTRLDLNKILGLSWVQKSRGITNEDSINIKDIILKTNTYSEIDLANLKTKLIISKFANIDTFTNSIVVLGDKEYIPYTNLSLNNDLMLKILDLISDLEAFVSFFKSHKTINESEFDQILTIINRVVNYKNIIEEENKDLFKINKFMHKLKELNILNIDYLNFKNFILDILKNSSNSKFNSNIGISFDSFNPNVILNYKYVFFIGLSSDKFPRLNTYSELDLRDKIDEYENVKQSFYLTKLNSENFYISLESMNLKNSEEYYPSIIINDIFDVTEKNITIDETRSYENLFTRSEFKNKGYAISLLNETIKNKEFVYTCPRDFARTIDIKKFSDFLNEPFSFKVKQLFPYNDESFSQIEEEFEPIKMDTLTSLYIYSSLVPYIFNYGLSNIDDVFKFYLLSSKIPSVKKEISELDFKNIVNKIINQITIMKEEYSPLTKSIEPIIINVNDTDVLISSAKQVFFKEYENNVQYIDLINSDSMEIKHVIRLYVNAILDISSKDEKIYNVDLVIFGYSKKETKYSFNIKPSEAKTLLESIFTQMINYKDLFVLPARYINSDKINSLETFLDNLNQEHINFKDKIMFDKYNDFGYSYENFDEEFKLNQEKMKKLLIFLPDSKETNEEV